MRLTGVCAPQFLHTCSNHRCAEGKRPSLQHAVRFVFLGVIVARALGRVLVLWPPQPSPPSSLLCIFFLTFACGVLFCACSLLT